jgi:uncharacterized protein RhaS with RHS repeats
LHHNGFRDYHPTTGRYIESDPVGLAAGLNTYAYVRNNPLRVSDLLGLTPEGAAIGGVAGAGVGAVFGGIIGSAGGSLVAPGVGTLGGGIAGAGQGAIDGAIIGSFLGDAVSNALDNIQLTNSHPPGFWPGDKGSEEWGRRDGCGAAEGKRRFHKGVKQSDNMSKATDNYGVNPETGDVIDPEGEIIGNLGE